MPRIGVKGLILSDLASVAGHEIASIPILDLVFARISNAIDGQLDNTNIAAGGVATANLADASVTAVKLAAASVTSAAVDSTVPKITMSSYVGDGSTANRTVSLPFTPRWVFVLRTDATFIEFFAIAPAATSFNWYRDNTGTQGALAANWQGIVSGGFKLGTSAVGTSNVNAVTYVYLALG